MLNRIFLFAFLIAFFTGGTCLPANDTAEKSGLEFWPYRETLCMPAGVRQFMFMKFPLVKKSKKVALRITLPAGVTVYGFARGNSWAVPVAKAYPDSWKQKGCVAELYFKNIPHDSSPDWVKNYREQYQACWLPLILDVNSPEGEGKLTVEFLVENKQIETKTFPVKIYPKLQGLTPKKLAMAACNYNSFSAETGKIYLQMLQAAGLNELWHVRGGEKNPDSLSPLMKSLGIRGGLLFFQKDCFEFIRQELAGQIEDASLAKSDSWILDHPELLCKGIKKNISSLLNGRDESYYRLIYDAESSALRRGKACGDLSPYGLKSFADWANLPKSEKLDSRIITEKYADKWVEFRCLQSERFLECLRETALEHWPDMQLGVYSGYRFSVGANRDRTKKFYSVDWQHLAESGNIDFGATGYGGSIDIVAETSGILSSGGAAHINSIMYLDSKINTERRMKAGVDELAISIISSYMATNLKGGIMIWYGNRLDGSALIVMDKVASFMAGIEPYALNGKRDNGAVRAIPAGEQNNVYVLRRGRNAMLVVLNDSPDDKNIRLALQGFTVHGHMSDLEITDVVDGKRLKADKLIKIKIPAYASRMFEIIDDGN